ncbi:MAG TPA: helix-turn-helix domain-containing protein [Streptosporangiaceae bacterium]|jgi:AcrR family transcriptional regulator
MPRPGPTAVERLQKAALELFHERGYAHVTVEEIANRAGMTKRSFFYHFADKREVLFAGAGAFEESVIRYLAETSGALDPVEAAVSALTRGGYDLTSYGPYARERRELIASSIELQERSLIKMATLAAAVAAALTERAVPTRIAAFAAQSAVAVFTIAYDDWADDITADFGVLMQRSLADLRQAAGC